MSVVCGLNRLLSAESAALSLVQVRYSRRIVRPPVWVTPKFHPLKNTLYKEDSELIERLLMADPDWQRRRAVPAPADVPVPFHLVPGVPDPPDCTANSYSFEHSWRIGLVGRKIGMTLQWMRDGTRQLCTLIHIPDNVVLSANDPETWYRHSPAGKLSAYKREPLWSQIVGAQDFDSVWLTDSYRRMFGRVDVPVKKFLGGFRVSEDAIIKPGTKLDVRHFKVGQFVTVSGKSIDWGFQGVMHRWGMRGQMRRVIGPTKAHRRVGSIGSKGEAKVWPGRRLPGHMGWEWRRMVGLEVVRINPIKQVLYVRGAVPGDIDEDEMLLIKDTRVEEKRVQEPPFPTFYPPPAEAEQQLLPEEVLQRQFGVSSQDIYHPDLHRFTDSSIVFTESDETKFTVRDKTRAKTAKIKK